ncbi:MAG: ATP-binding protein [Bryobacteraceae bacterium]
MIFQKRSILLKLIGMTSAILTVIFVLTGYLLEKSISARATQSVEQEVVTSFRAYESLWREHTENLREISSVISRMADVRSALRTSDRATIQDTAGELWAHISSANAIFAVTDGNGRVIATIGKSSPFQADEILPFVRQISSTFPTQRIGFFEQQGRLFQTVVTPVYVDVSDGRGLLNVLVTGFELDTNFIRDLKLASGGSDFIFNLRGTVLASTLADAAQTKAVADLCYSHPTGGIARRLVANGVAFLAINRELPGIVPGRGGELCIVRSLAGYQQTLTDLRHRIFFLWLGGLVAAIVCAYAVARRMMRPIAVLDRASAEIAKGNYKIRVNTDSDDELGRLGESFNSMCTSLESARAELIQQERLTSVARLATIVVHDLRNPLASIYAGAEMLVDNELPRAQITRLAHNMYQASRGVLEILQELLSAARNKKSEPELWSLYEVATNAWNALSNRLERRSIKVEWSIPPDLELKMDRMSMERVFHNLFENALNAMGDEGTLSLVAEIRENSVDLHVRDSGKGIPPELQSTLFQPFATKGNGEGLGLGLALSRQTVIAHGGDLWADFTFKVGSHFIIRLPRESKASAPAVRNETLDLIQR